MKRNLKVALFSAFAFIATVATSNVTWFNFYKPETPKKYMH